jgi:hypothetical protein
MPDHRDGRRRVGASKKILTIPDMPIVSGRNNIMRNMKQSREFLMDFIVKAFALSECLGYVSGLEELM